MGPAPVPQLPSPLLAESVQARMEPQSWHPCKTERKLQSLGPAWPWVLALSSAVHPHELRAS